MTARVTLREQILPKLMTGTGDDDDGPPRDPAIDRAFGKLTEALQAADNDLAKMRAIRDCAEALEPLGDDEAIRALVEMGHACGISADNIETMERVMEGIVEQGFEIARQKRARATAPLRTNGGIRQDGTRREREAPEEWPIPHPLPDNLLPVAPFDLNLVPEKLQPWISDVCERMQCPPDYIGVSLMAALGSLIGRKIAICPMAHDDWKVIANMWALLIGRPGVLKSPAMEEALRPLRKLSSMAEEVLKKEYATYEVSASVAKLRHDQSVKKAAGLLKKDPKADVSSLLEPEQQTSEPTLKRYIANDTNVASLGVLLQQNPNGLLVFRDEIVSLMDNLDREECVGERGFYLTGWNGDSRYTFDRIGRGLHLTIDGVCLSMLGSTQPGRISQYLSRAIKGGRGDDGLIQRFGLAGRFVRMETSRPVARQRGQGFGHEAVRKARHARLARHLWQAGPTLGW
jgi:hypothetical protein